MKPRRSPSPAPATAGEARPGPVQVRRIGPSERLSATMALSAILVGVLVLGVVFTQDDAAPVQPTLDVILTQTSTPQPPKQADFLAQANNQGGGDRDKARRPREDQVGQVPKPQVGIAAQPLRAQAPPPAPPPRQRLVTTVGAATRSVSAPEDQPSEEPLPLPSGHEMIQRNLEMARLAASLDQQRELYAKRPKKKAITANTQEYEYAAYMRAWARKVERVGTLNLPEEARRGASGSVVLTVSVGRQGEVTEVLIQYSSGRKALDDAAVRIVNLSSPFAPLPRTAENIDILQITRTLQFKNGSVGSD